MKKFISKILAFSIIQIAIITITIAAFKYKIYNIKINPSIHTLILGDSHTQTGLDDSKINNSLNVSQSSEHFLYSYNVLKLFLENNTPVNKVILGVSFHSFSKFYDKYIHDEDKTVHMFPKYFPILDLESIKDINEFPLAEFRNIFKNIVTDLFNNSEISNYAFIGKFYKSNRSNLTDSIINATIQRHYLTETGDAQSYSSYQLKYLKKIVELCNSKNIELIIVNTPIYKRYYKRIPVKFVSNYYSTIQQFEDKIHFYDFHSVNFPQDSYGDGDHLNSIGAKRFSLMVSEQITKEN